jgi:hypothetical protein
MLYGPNTNNNSLITMLEIEAGYAVRHIRRAIDRRIAWLDVRPQSMAAWNSKVQRDIAGIDVWQDDCRGYYRAPSGLNVTQCPYTMTNYATMLAAPDVRNYATAKG